MTRADVLVLLLSAAAGAIDAVSFIGFGVFTSAMTGNTALLGVAIGQGKLQAGIKAAVALAAYVLGALAATAVETRTGGRVRLILVVEAVLLAGFAAMVLAGSRLHPPLLSRSVAIGLGAMGMGAQAIAARAVDAPGIPTVVFTSTLTAITEAIGRFLFGGKKAKSADTGRQAVAFCCYAIGAVLGGVFTGYWNIGAAVPVGLAAIALAVGAKPKALASDRPSPPRKAEREEPG